MGLVNIGIVGADGRKWIPEQEVEAKARIHDILFFGETPAKSIKKGIPVPNPETVLVSGHCPVGKERWYCSITHEWHTDNEIARHEHQGDDVGNPTCHSFVYDKGGVDSWAEMAADELGIKKKIYPAEVHQWDSDFDMHGGLTVEHRGYKSRNIQIAKASDILYVLSPKRTAHCRHCMVFGHLQNGGCWTGKYADHIGKKVVRITV